MQVFSYFSFVISSGISGIMSECWTLLAPEHVTLTDPSRCYETFMMMQTPELLRQTHNLK
jgi:hypothetical protein